MVHTLSQGNSVGLHEASVQHCLNTKERELLKRDKPKTYYETSLPSDQRACRSLVLRYGCAAGDSYTNASYACRPYYHLSLSSLDNPTVVAISSFG